MDEFDEIVGTDDSIQSPLDMTNVDISLAELGNFCDFLTKHGTGVKYMGYEHVPTGIAYKYMRADGEIAWLYTDRIIQRKVT